MKPRRAFLLLFSSSSSSRLSMQMFLISASIVLLAMNVCLSTAAINLANNGLLSSSAAASKESQSDSCASSSSYSSSWPTIKLGNKNYYIGHFFKANWFKAWNYCRFHGMHLVSIQSKAENDLIEKTVQEYGYGNEHFWTSGNDLGSEGEFSWFGIGHPLSFTNWNAGEPNNFQYENGEEEHCLELWNRDGKGLKWNDTPCSFETYFICER